MGREDVEMTSKDECDPSSDVNSKAAVEVGKRCVGLNGTGGVVANSSMASSVQHNWLGIVGSSGSVLLCICFILA